MRNWFAPLAGVVCVAAALAACGHSSPSAPDAAATRSAATGRLTRAVEDAAPAAGGPAAVSGGVAATASAAAGPAPQGAAAARQDEPATAQADSADCLAAARNVLGQDAEVLKCGFLNQRDVLESVAIVRKPLKHKARDDLASRLVILRRVNSSWVTALDASHGTRNEAGYIATDFVDDDAVVWAYRVKLYRTLPDGERKFALEIAPVHDERDGWAVGTEISFDRRVSRYREFSVDGGTFQAENKNPPHVHVRKAGAAPSARATHS